MDKRKILVVDDEIDIVETLIFMLKSRGFEIIIAHDGGEGLAKAKSEHPDIILLDITMPVMDGISVCAKLKASKDTAKIPVIMFSAKGESESVSSAKRVGANDYIVKPFNLPVLLAKLNKFLAK
jgi:DNA-binding response OmpR family regulator